MKRRFVGPGTALLLVLAGCARSCSTPPQPYGAYVSDFPAPLWDQATYAANPTPGTRDELVIDEHRIGYVVDGQRTILTDRSSFRVIEGPEKIAYALPLPEEKGFLFIGNVAPVETWFSERFDGPLRSLGRGTPCRLDRMSWLNGPRNCQQKTSIISLATGRAFPMAEDLLLLFDDSGENTRVVSLPSGEPPPKGTPRPEDLFTLADGLAFLRGPDGLFVREPGTNAWKRIGSEAVSSISYDESGVTAYGDLGPTRLVETGTAIFRAELRDALAKIIPETKTRALSANGRFDRATWTLETNITTFSSEACSLQGPAHDLFTCPDHGPNNRFDPEPHKDRIFRLLPLPWEASDAGSLDGGGDGSVDGGSTTAPEPFYPGMPLPEPPPQLEWEGEVGSLESLRSNQYGTLFQGMDCLGKKARFALCERSGSTWQATTLSAALNAIPEAAELSFFSAPLGEVLVFGREPDGALTIALGKMGRIRRFSKDELPTPVTETLTPQASTDAGADGGDAGDGGTTSDSTLPLAMRIAIAKTLDAQTPKRSLPQFLVTPKSALRIVGIYASNAKTYSIELSFDTQPELDTFDGYASFSGPYGLGIHQNGGLFESLDGAHSFLRVPGPPLRTSTPADGKTLHCYPAGCRVGLFERRGYGPRLTTAGKDAGSDAR